MRINLQSPLQARRWLLLLKPDAECGFRMQPGLNVPRKYLGFSVSSNSLGLRGPEDSGGRNVIMGTSFAMGQSVNNGENWYERLNLARGWLNLGIPVGVKQWAVLLEKHGNASDGDLVVVYHPNIWPHCSLYRRWARSGLDVFKALGWRTSRITCVRLALRQRFTTAVRLRTGRLLSVRQDGVRYMVDCAYSSYELEKLRSDFEEGVEALGRMASRFRRCFLIRVPTKQDLVPTGLQNDLLKETLGNYELMWRLTVERLQGAVQSIDCRDRFRLGHFHPEDTHWNAAGNAEFAQCFKQITGCGETR